MPTTSQQPISTDDALAAVIIRRKPHPETGLYAVITRTESVPLDAFMKGLCSVRDTFKSHDGTPAGEPVIVDGREALGVVLVESVLGDDGEPGAELRAFAAGLPHAQVAEQIQRAIEELEVELAATSDPDALYPGNPAPAGPLVAVDRMRDAVEDVARYQEDAAGGEGRHL